MTMVIFHSYVSLPEGNGFFTPRIVESWMFIPIHSLKIWTSVLIEDWPTGDWLTTDQPHDGGISDFVPWRLGITTNQIATPKTNMEPIWNPYILGLEMFGDVWSLEFMDSIYIFCQGCTPPCSHLTRTLCGIAAVFIFGSAAARVSAPVSPDGPWPHPFCKSCRRSWISLFPRRAPCIGSISSCWDHGGGSRVRPCPVMSMLHPSPSPCPVMSMLHPSVSAFAFALSFCHGEF